MSKQSKTVWVTGHTGLVGSAVVKAANDSGYLACHPVSSGEDLRRYSKAHRLCVSIHPDWIIHCAGRVGGIDDNRNYPVDYHYDNAMMYLNLLKAAHEQNVEKLLYLGSSCIYPQDAHQPISEHALLTGPLEETNEAYALAKIGGVKHCQHYRQQYGCNFISAMPTNLYGDSDRFHHPCESTVAGGTAAGTPNRSHVIPALIHRFHDAWEKGRREVIVWGDGTAMREFLHADDLARACLFLMENYDGPEPINIGSGEEVTIAKLARMIQRIVHPDSVIEFAAGMPTGPSRKVVDSSKIRKLGWEPQITLEDGLVRTVEAYKQWLIETRHNSEVYA